MKPKLFKQGIITIPMIIIIAISIITISSCNKDEMDNIVPVTNYSYYVKHVIKGNGSYGRFSNWSVTTPQGKFTNSGTQVRDWTQTFGPLNKGFKCDVQIGNYIVGAPTIEIQVSKNKEPFALKENKTGNSASYAIDF